METTPNIAANTATLSITLSMILGYLYTAILAALALYAIHLLIIITLYIWHQRAPSPSPPKISDNSASEATVTVQIPLRNERYVVQRILQAVAQLDWPRERLEIQVLDDSDDDTTALAKEEVTRLRAQGLNIYLRHRARPQGHKAGAMAAGLRVAMGDFIAIFDADFCPPADFLRRTVPYFLADPGLGMVQARWGHLNAEYSPVTRAQALVLDAHFTVEHIARNRSGLWMNFNGTAGVWRRRAIEDAGGWQSDTIAEDLDLSYRAQLAGWRALYLPDVVAPAEIPPLVSAFKQQQYRWAKGAAQTLRKLAGPILRAPTLKPHQKAMALLHLSGYFTQPLFLALLLLSLPMVLYSPRLPALAAFLGSVSAIPPLLYLLGQIKLYRDWPRRILAYPVLMLLGIAISWSTTLALLDGMRHWGGTFVRTPKFCLRGDSGTWRDARYHLTIDRALAGEVFIILYALTTLGLALTLERGHAALASKLLPLVLIYLGGELLMVGMTFMQRSSDT